MAFLGEMEMHKVLLAIDGSEASNYAARFLAHLPHSGPLELNLVSVLQNPFSRSNYAASDLLKVAYERDKAFALETFQKVAEMFEGANATVRHVIKEGNIGEAIVAAAKDQQADLVVVGATGRSQVSRILLGSVSDHVATHAPCSVLVVRPMEVDESDRAVRVCVAYQGNGPAQAALEEITEIPWRTGSEFHVLTVAPALYDYSGELKSDSDIAVRCKADLQFARDQLDEVAPSVKTHLIQCDHIGEGIVDFAEKKSIDLMVIGESPRSVIGRFVTGSTTRYVLRHAPCSVWITRNRVIEGIQKHPEKREAVS
jgi:nucleotide-binding universal stress UspA family protein